MLVEDPYKLLEGKLPKPLEISFEEVEKFIKKQSKHIGQIAVGTIRNVSKTSYFEKHESEIVTVKALHYQGGILAEYKVMPEIRIDHDGTVRHVIRSVFIYGGMSPEITIHTEEENSGVRCANLKIFGIKKYVWGLEEEIKEIVEATELAEQAKQTIVDRLELDGISVY